MGIVNILLIIDRISWQDDRSVIYRNELFENLKDRINEVVQPEKRVSIKLALNVDNFKTDN